MFGWFFGTQKSETIAAPPTKTPESTPTKTPESTPTKTLESTPTLKPIETFIYNVQHDPKASTKFQVVDQNSYYITTFVDTNLIIKQIIISLKDTSSNNDNKTVVIKNENSSIPIFTANDTSVDSVKIEIEFDPNTFTCSKLTIDGTEIPLTKKDEHNNQHIKKAGGKRGSRRSRQTKNRKTNNRKKTHRRKKSLKWGRRQR